MKKFDALFRLQEIHGSLKLSTIYLKKIYRYLNNDKTLIQQIKNQVNRIDCLCIVLKPK